MNVSVIGIGRLGLCFSLMLEKNGYNIIGVDISQDYVDSINSKSFNSKEPGVDALLQKSKNLIATTDISKAVEHSDLLFVIVPTNTLENGHYDHSIIDNIANQLLSLPKQNNKHLIICCTTIPGYCSKLADK